MGLEEKIHFSSVTQRDMLQDSAVAFQDDSESGKDGFSTCHKEIQEGRLESKALSSVGIV